MDRKNLEQFLDSAAKILEEATPIQRRRIYEKLSVLKSRLVKPVVESKQDLSADFLEER